VVVSFNDYAYVFVKIQCPKITKIKQFAPAFWHYYPLHKNQDPLD
jgi:hypothetical protein